MVSNSSNSFANADVDGTTDDTDEELVDNGVVGVCGNYLSDDDWPEYGNSNDDTRQDYLN